MEIQTSLDGEAIVYGTNIVAGGGLLLPDVPKFRFENWELYKKDDGQIKSLVIDMVAEDGTVLAKKRYCGLGVLRSMTDENGRGYLKGKYFSTDAKGFPKEITG